MSSSNEVPGTLNEIHAALSEAAAEAVVDRNVWVVGGEDLATRNRAVICAIYDVRGPSPPRP